MLLVADRMLVNVCLFWSWIYIIGYIWWWTYCFYGSTWYISGLSAVLPRVSEPDRIMRMRTSTYSSIYIYNGCLASCDVNSTYYSSVEYSQLGYVLYSLNKFVNTHLRTHLFANQADTDREIQRNTMLDITKHIVIELTQQITNSFMQWNKNSPYTLVTVKKS